MSLTGGGGCIHGIEDTLRTEERFFVGGDNLRGFATGGIGPRDLATNDALGGNIYYVGTVSLGFPVGLPQELGITGRVFSDFGSLFNLDEKGDTIADPHSVRVSAGLRCPLALP